MLEEKKKKGKREKVLFGWLDFKRAGRRRVLDL